ncbi:MAG: FAD:protein FMN transferase [Chloroflexi bacterium]|nr:FAD:protein FMN transferase [Chloroflexota bacterium]
MMMTGVAGTPVVPHTMVSGGRSTIGVAMDTVVSIDVLDDAPEAAVQAAMRRALDWFELVERGCSRFDPTSEIRRLTARVGEPVVVSPMLFEAVRFAVALARLTDGAFDPTIGGALEAAGFDRHYVTGERIPAAPGGQPGHVSYRDIRLDATRRTIVLRRPLVLDLGAVAKGLAIDLAARELAAFESVSIDAGGDLYVRGRLSDGRPRRVGVQSPRDPEWIAHIFDLAEGAVCTSGNYERRTADGLSHHLVNPRTGRSAVSLASVTVVAPTAMAADGLATAAFVLGPQAGRHLLEREGVGGVLITASGEISMTRDLGSTLP